MSLVHDPEQWNPDDIPTWREKELWELGFKGEWPRFLSFTKIDLNHLRRLISKGCDPVTAARIVAGTDFAGEDRQFDWKQFERLVRDHLDEKPEPITFEELAGIVPDAPPEDDQPPSLAKKLLGK